MRLFPLIHKQDIAYVVSVAIAVTTAAVLLTGLLLVICASLH